MIPDDVDFMVAFVVDDIREELAEVEQAGLDVVGGPILGGGSVPRPDV